MQNDTKPIYIILSHNEINFSKVIFLFYILKKKPFGYSVTFYNKRYKKGFVMNFTRNKKHIPQEIQKAQNLQKLQVYLKL